MKAADIDIGRVLVFVVPGRAIHSQFKLLFIYLVDFSYDTVHVVSSSSLSEALDDALHGGTR